jgi:Raf kinase inhibitor-like YbhB/YbcL family protein
MPVRFATRGVEGGAGVSVPLLWDGVPAGARSLALAIIDIHPVAHNWVHWLVTDIPTTATAMPEGASRTSAMPRGAVEHPGTRGEPGYSGPQPPVGSGVHDYVATLYALDVGHLVVDAGAPWDLVHDAMLGHVLAQATLTGRFGR